MIVVAVTNVEWFKTLRALPQMDVVNFWRPGSANFRALQPGELMYFLLASPIRKIGGYGTFESFEKMTVSEAWMEFGAGNGALSVRELQQRLGLFEGAVPGADRVDKEIGCVRLSNPVFLDDSEFKSPEELGIEFANSIVAYKTFPDIRTLLL